MVPTPYKPMTAIVYHRVDWDGYTSAAVALRAFPDADLIGWTYRDPFPIVDNYDCVVLVDLTIYSVNSDGSRDFSWMLDNQSKLIWIDHHPIISDVPGKYVGIQEQGIGACWLTWKYFHDVYGISCNTSHIKYAATFDVFRKDGWLCSWDDAWAYQCYLNRFGPGYTPEAGDRSKELVEHACAFLESNEIEIENHLRDGQMFENERALKEARLFEQHACKIRIDNYIGWIIETVEQPAMAIKTHSDNGDGQFFVLFSRDKKDKDGHYCVSVRVPESSDFSAKAFAEAHLGGGHLKAAGCFMTDEEINNLYDTSII